MLGKTRVCVSQEVSTGSTEPSPWVSKEGNYKYPGVINPQHLASCPLVSSELWTSSTLQNSTRYWCPHNLSPPWLKKKKKKRWTGLPWWLSGKESTCQCRRHRFNPWSRKIPRTMEHLRPCAPQLLGLCSRAGSPNYWAHVLQLLTSACPKACAPQQEKPLQWVTHCNQRAGPACHN